MWIEGMSAPPPMGIPQGHGWHTRWFPEGIEWHSHWKLREQVSGTPQEFLKELNGIPMTTP